MLEGRPRLEIVPLDTQRLELIPLDPIADAPALHAMESDAAVHRFSDDDVSASVEETQDRLTRQVMANGNTTWAIRLRGGEAIGTIGVFSDHPSTIRGVGWSLASAYWRQGITSEAARVAIPYLLAQPGVDGLEAWVDSRNVGSVGVALAAGMAERGRLPRTYRDHVGQTIVMARAAVPADPEVFGFATTLDVTDLQATLAIMQSVVGLRLAWSYPDPPTIACLAATPWAGSASIRFSQATAPVVPRRLTVEVGISVDLVYQRVLTLVGQNAGVGGVTVVSPPTDMLWYRREFAWTLPDGHVITISGPSSPENSSAS